VLLKLHVYGYLNRVQSSRRLEREAGRNVELMWLLGRLIPDHKTVADFRKHYGSAIDVQSRESNTSARGRLSDLGPIFHRIKLPPLRET
jgi:hypothetical protein